MSRWLRRKQKGEDYVCVVPSPPRWRFLHVLAIDFAADFFPILVTMHSAAPNQQWFASRGSQSSCLDLYDACYWVWRAAMASDHGAAQVVAPLFQHRLKLAILQDHGAVHDLRPCYASHTLHYGVGAVSIG